MKLWVMISGLLLVAIIGYSVNWVNSKIRRGRSLTAAIGGIIFPRKYFKETIWVTLIISSIVGLIVSPLVLERSFEINDPLIFFVAQYVLAFAIAMVGCLLLLMILNFLYKTFLKY